MQRNPKQTIAKLIEELSSYEKQKKKNDMELTRIAQQVKKLAETEPCDSFMALGIIKTLQGNEDEANNYFKKALHIETKATVLANHARSAYAFGSYNLACKQAKQAASLEPDNIAYLKNYMIFSFLSGSYISATEATNGLQKLGVEVAEQTKNAVFISSFCTKNNLSVEDFQAVYTFVLNLSLKHGLKITDVDNFEDPENPGLQMFIHFCVEPSEPQSVVSANIELAETLPGRLTAVSLGLISPAFYMRKTRLQS